MIMEGGPREDALLEDGTSAGATRTPIGAVTWRRIDVHEVLQPLAEDVNRQAIEALRNSDPDTFNRIRSANPGKYPVLVGERLRETRLPGVDFSYAHLQAADLSNADLTGANLRGAVMRLADANGANLREADFHSAILVGANLTAADLTNAKNLSADQLLDARFRGCRGLTEEFIGELLYRLHQSLNP